MTHHLQSVARSPALYPVTATYLCAVLAVLAVSSGVLSAWQAAVSLGVLAALIVSVTVAYETRRQVRALRLALIEARREEDADE